MTPSYSWAELRGTKPSQYLVRFSVGGAIALVAHVTGHYFGPRVGGLFLAFPALLPAALTLVKQHDGRTAAADDARGAMLGCVGLASFAVVMWMARASSALVSLALALVTWCVVSASAWWLIYGPWKTRSA